MTRAALAVLLAGAALLTIARPAAADTVELPAQRVLIISLPKVDWADVQRADVPNLRSLLETSGVAGLSSPGVAYEPTIADAYLTISAGARAQDAKGGFERIVRHNNYLLYDARIGALGDALARAGVQRVVIGSPVAALALATRDGAVTTVRRDQFDCVWNDRTVALVEKPPGESLEQFDPQIGALLQRVDPATDAVLVVGPTEGRLTLTVAGLRAPQMQAGLMRSAFTRHSGIVGIVDVAPTVLDVLGIERPDHMEGRAFVYGRTGGDFDQRVHWLTTTNARSQFRDTAVFQVGAVFATCVFVLAGIACLLVRARRRLPPSLQVASLALLFFLPVTNLAVLLPFQDWGLPAYWAFLLTVSLGAGLVAYFATPRRGLVPVMLALGAIVALIIIDQLAGGHLQFNAAFGYSPTLGGRFAGLGNLGYAQLAAASLLLAGFIAHLVAGRAGVRLAIALLAVALVVDGAPFFGADVGGVLSLVPAFGVAAAMLLGWRFRWRLVALLGLAAVALLGILAAIDLSRPAENRSHLGRFLAGNSGDLGVVLERKLSANISVVTSTPVTWLLPVIYIAGAYLVYRSPEPLLSVRRWIPELTASLVGLAFAVVLGTLLNDSGIEITAMMFNILVPTLVVLCARVREPAPKLSVVGS